VSRKYPQLATFVVLTLSAGLVSCAFHTADRDPASSDESATLRKQESVFREVWEADEARNLAQVAYEQVPPAYATSGNGKTQTDLNTAKRREKKKIFERSEARLQQLQNWAKGLTQVKSGSLEKIFVPIKKSFPGMAEDVLQIWNTETYAPSKNAFFVFPMNEIKDYKLSIFNRIPKAKFNARLVCDGPFNLTVPGFFNNKKNVRDTSFPLKAHALLSDRVIFSPAGELNRCDLSFSGTVDGRATEGKLRFVKVADKFPGIAELFEPGFEGCLLPELSKDGPDKFFLSTRFRNITCPTESSRPEPLPDPIEAIQAKVEALLGQRLPNGFIEGNNPYAPLDYSQMPKLDAILISSLVFRADYHGTILRRLVEEHAKRGAMVRIVVTQVLTRGLDLAAMEEMMAAYPNIRVQYFDWDNRAGAGKGSMLDGLHRTMHHKIFITLSARDPSRNVAIMGGRNIHDGFAFTNAPDMSAFPKLVNYGKKGEAWSPWRDFEVRIRSPRLIESLTRHWNLFWLRDSESFTVPNVAVALPAARAPSPMNPDQVWIRHFMSIPFKDGQQLEDFYVDMIASARKTVLITSPYFRPTKKIGAALVAAADRGVKVTIVTRLDLKGDTADFILGDVNKAGVNSLNANATIYEYTVPREILHTKLVLIDDTLSFVGSVNLNKRSFIHDIESGLLIHNKAFNAETRKMIDGFIELSSEIEEELKIKFWKRVLLGVFDTYF
jgi:cardiolipin synthase A/B